MLSVSAVSFIPAPTLAINPVMSLHGRNVLVSVSTTSHVRNVSPYILLSVNTSTPLVNYVCHNVRHVQRPKFVPFKSKVSVTSKFKYVSSSPLYTIFVVILFHTFSFTQSTKAILVCNIFSIVALFLLVYIRFYTKIGGGLIYDIPQYKHFFTCFLDYLYICESLKIAWLISQTKFSSTFKILVLVALCLIKCFGTRAFLTKFHLCLRNFKLCEKCNLLLVLLVHFSLSTGFLVYYFFRFLALVFTNTFSFVFVFFGAFTKYKSLALLLILSAAVCIMREPPYKNDCVIFNSVNRPLNSTYKANVFNKFLTFLTNFSVNVYVAINILMNSDTIACGKVPSGEGLYHIETSQLIYSADQSGGLCMVQVFEKSDFQTIYHLTDFWNNLRHILK